MVSSPIKSFENVGTCFIAVFEAQYVSKPLSLRSGDFFVRSAKWIPSGGAGLVSGRGNFRPGFTGRDWRSAIAEPNFRKRSVESWYSDEY
ncbi:unnamed protein product [Haemonchus placei]|uniref:Uncharacterized protein n=1 Tax=Haemonchus placei TaxID=6290 RepID=A0A0N4VVG2_HAEPC|nr:unnamed protein product [Haemonchus placei]